MLHFVFVDWIGFILFNVPCDCMLKAPTEIPIPSTQQGNMSVGTAWNFQRQTRGCIFADTD